MEGKRSDMARIQQSFGKIDTITAYTVSEVSWLTADDDDRGRREGFSGLWNIYFQCNPKPGGYIARYSTIGIYTSGELVLSVPENIVVLLL